MSEFEKYHPAVLFFYFLMIMLITMLSTNPKIPAISLSGAVAYSISTGGMKGFFKDLRFYIPFFILVAVTNPLVSHNGNTVLFFIRNNKITLESVCYGLMTALMLVAVVFWFKCINNIMSSDKIIYLFGKTVPKLSVILALSLRFVPLLKRQAGRISNTQKAMGMYSSQSLADRFLGGIRVFSALITWALENAMDTADSMKARGYGLPGRTSFSLYKWTKRDTFVLICTAVMATEIIICMIQGKLGYQFYPVMKAAEYTGYTTFSYIIFTVMAFIPFLVEIKERLMWKLLISKI